MTSSTEHLKQLRQWYLARLRKRALADAANIDNLTPATLIKADQKRLEQLMSAPAKKDESLLSPPSKLLNSSLTWLGLICLYLLQLIVCFMLYASGGGLAQSFAMLLLLWVLTSFIAVNQFENATRSRTLTSYILTRSRNSAVFRETNNESNNLVLEEQLVVLMNQLDSLAHQQNLIADYSEEVICTLNESLQFVSVAPSSFHNWGLPPQSLVGRPLGEFIADKDRDSTLQAFDKNCVDLSFDTQIVSNERIIDTRWTVEWSSGAELFFAVIRDISVEVQIDRTKNEVIAIVSHDLRSPITNIQWTLKLLRNGIYGELNESGRKRLRDAQRTVEFLLDMVADLLDLHRIETGEPQIVYSRCDLATLIEESLESVRELANSKGITLNYQGETGPCDLDPDRIKRVLINLVANGIKFSPKGTCITVQSSFTDKEVELIVRDEGRGIKPEFLEKLFDRYCNVGNPAARREGSGLGLFASKAIVEAHQGRISVESTENIGTKFSVILPKTCPLTESERND